MTADSAESQPPQGTILPPPEVRSVIEKTVGYVSRQGQAFVNRIRESERSNPKFSFIHEDDPYYKYYEWRLEEHKAGRSGVAESTKGGESSLPEAQKGPQEPPKFLFSTDLPPVSAQDLDIIKLTARYVAKSGPQFMTALGHREAKNFQFDFLKPTHSLYALFTALVDQYKKVLKPPRAVKEKVAQGIQNKYEVLGLAKARAEWTAFKEERDQKAAQEAEHERISYAQIDWHDFVVVETIEFSQADLDTGLPPPLSLSQVQYASFEQKRKGIYQLEEAPPDYEDDNSSRPVEELAPKRPLPPQVSRPPPMPTEAPLPSIPVAHKPQAEPVATPDTAPRPAPPSMKIRSAGTSIRSKLMNSKERTLISPFTGEPVPESQYDEHMRIMSLDPKWKEQRRIEESRRATTNLSTADLDINLKRLASARSDLFDSEPADVQTNSKKLKTTTEVQWDGHSSSREAAKLQAQKNRPLEQERLKKQRAEEEARKIGPAAPSRR